MTVNSRSKKTSENASKPQPAVSPNVGQSLYLHIAGLLKQAIADGTYPVGAHLPTELELCQQFGISRFTAREAVRVLLVAGLISRKQRIGTVVIATPDDARFALDVTTLHGLLQYAQETELRLFYVGKVVLDKAQAKDFGATAGVEWIYAVGMRVDAAEGIKSSAIASTLVRPICLSRIYLNPTLKGIETKLRDRKGAIHSLIEREYKLPIQRVEQEIQGVIRDVDDAANLGVKPGSPALRIIRRYYGPKDQLLEVGDNLHPGERFSYRMELNK
jgi:GntR family transcriptional regulator